MSSGGNVHILCGSRDISLTCTDCGDETGGIDRDDLFIGGGPLDGELRGSLGNLFLLGFIVRAVRLLCERLAEGPVNAEAAR